MSATFVRLVRSSIVRGRYSVKYGTDWLGVVERVDGVWVAAARPVDSDDDPRYVGEYPTRAEAVSRVVELARL